MWTLRTEICSTVLLTLKAHCLVFVVSLSRFQKWFISLGPRIHKLNNNKDLSGIRCHYTPTMWHKFTSLAWLGEKKKIIIGLIIFHLFGILHSLFYTKSASMSPVTWGGALLLYRLTVAPWKAWCLTSPQWLISHRCYGLNMADWAEDVCLQSDCWLIDWVGGEGKERGTSTVEEEEALVWRK